MDTVEYNKFAIKSFYSFAIATLLLILPGTLDTVFDTPEYIYFFSLTSSFIISLIAILLGTIALKQIKRTGQQGDMLAILAISLSVAYLLLTAFLIMSIGVLTNIF